MKISILSMLLCLTVSAADVKLSELPAATNPSTNTFLLISDMNAVTKSQKFLATNYVRQSQIDTSAKVQAIIGQVYQATNATLTDLSGATPTINGDLNVTGTITNSTTQTDTLYLSSLTETNKLLGLGATTNAMVATAAMVTNTLGRTIGGTGALTSGDSTDTFSNKTFDAAGTGNVLKQTKYLYLMRPDWGDGTGAVPQTNTFTTSGLMHYTFSGSQPTNSNYVIYEAVVPPDIDTSVAMTAVFGFKSGGTDTDTVTWDIAYGLGAAGTAYPVTLGTVATSPLAFAAVTPTTPAAGDYQVTAELTLTDWAASMTPGTPLLISIRRVNDSNDDGQTDVFLRIKYGSTQ